MTGRPAFTLVELLIVVAIIALLMALLVPSAQGVMDFVKVAKCQKNLTAIHAVIMAYARQCDGEFPEFQPYYGGAIFHAARQDEPYEVTMKDVILLKQFGAQAEIMFCPFDPAYRSESWLWKTWSTKQYTASLGYTTLINRQIAEAGSPPRPALFADGRVTPTNMSCDDDVPLLADNLRYGANGWIYGWFHGRGAGGDLDDGFYNSSCNTLFRGGQVVFREWSDLERQGPGLMMGPGGEDKWWFALRP